jgi:CBS domain-containing protein
MSGFEPGSAQALEVGYHFGFVAIACVSCATLFMVVFFVRNTSPSQATASASAQSGKASVAEFAEREAALIAEAGEDGLRYVAGSMNRDPYKVHETDTIASVVRILVAKKTGGVSVVDDAGKVVGFISDGDIMKYLAAEDANLLDASLMIYHFTDPEDMSARVRSLMNMEVQSIMTRNVISLTEDISLGRACKIMVDKRLKKLPVVDEEGYLVGSLSRADVVRSTLSNMVEDAYSN